MPKSIHNAVTVLIKVLFRCREDQLKTEMKEINNILVFWKIQRDIGSKKHVLTR